MIIAVTLNKDSFKIISFHTFIIVFNIRLKYRFRKMIILMNNNFKENYISQRFVKENSLISNLIERIKESIDKYTVTIYRKHDLIIHIINSKNQN
jgi:hypothetical protein